LLRSIKAITIAVRNLDASILCYRRFLHYDLVATGTVSPAQASRWDAEKETGQPFALLSPASMEPVYIRLVESDAAINYQALRHFGWNAAELHVTDVHALAESLGGSPFRIIGGPRDLLDDGTVVALQVLGPSGECLYLTSISSEAMQQTYGRARSTVGRVFIAVLGVSDLQVSRSFYQSAAVSLTEPRPFNIRVLAAAHGLDLMETKFDIASAVFEEPFRIELDHYPALAKPLQRRPGNLAGGICMVTMTWSGDSTVGWINALDWHPGEDDAICQQGRVSTIHGPDGELIELLSA